MGLTKKNTQNDSACWWKRLIDAEVRTEAVLIPTEAVSRVRHCPIVVGVSYWYITLLFFMYRQQDSAERESRIATAAADDYCPATGNNKPPVIVSSRNYYSTGARDRQ